MLEEEIKKELESVYALLMNLQKFMAEGIIWWKST
jgi:hypothetical protein